MNVSGLFIFFLLPTKKDPFIRSSSAHFLIHLKVSIILVHTFIRRLPGHLRRGDEGLRVKRAADTIREVAETLENVMVKSRKELMEKESTRYQQLLKNAGQSLKMTKL